MREFPALTVPLMMIVVGWLCTRRPTMVVRFMTSWVDHPTSTGQLNKSQEIAQVVREHPDTWPQQYPLVYKQIRLTGFAAYVISGASVVILLLSWVLPATA